MWLPGGGDQHMERALEPSPPPAAEGGTAGTLVAAVAAGRAPRPAMIVDPPDRKVPFQPWALAKGPRLSTSKTSSSSSIRAPLSPGRCAARQSADRLQYLSDSADSRTRGLPLQWSHPSIVTSPRRASACRSEDPAMDGDPRGHWEETRSSSTRRISPTRRIFRERRAGRRHGEPAHAVRSVPHGSAARGRGVLP
jgi:hypothetical protein